MKKIKKVLSLLLIACMFISMLPATLSFAEDTTNVTRVTDINSIPSSFEGGHVLTYHADETNRRISVDVGVYHTPMGTNWYSGIKYDTSKISLYDPVYETVLEESYEYAAEYPLMPSTLTSDTNYQKSNITDSRNGIMTLVEFKAGPDETDSSFGRFYGSFMIRTGTTDTHAKKFLGTGYNSDRTAFTFDVDAVTNIYTVHFALNEGVDFDDLTPDTIEMTQNDEAYLYDAPSGSVVLYAGEGKNHKTLMRGFPEKKYDIELTILDSDEKPVVGAFVEAKKAASADEVSTVEETGEESDVAASGTTDAQGKVTLQLASGSYTYTVTATGYNNLTNGSLTVDDAGVATGTEATMTKLAATLYKTKLEFKDKDTKAALENVSVVVTETKDDGTDGTTYEAVTSGSDGIANINLPEGVYSFAATLAGYNGLTKANATSFSVSASTDDTIVGNWEMEKIKAPTYAVEFTVKGALSEDAEEATNLNKASIIISQGENQLGTYLTGDGGTNAEEIKLEAGSYSYKVTYGGYEPKEGTFEVLADGENSVAVTLIKLPTSALPKYIVKGEFAPTVDGGDEGILTVTAYVDNITTYGGSFGLKYDTEALTLVETDGNYAEYNDDETNGVIDVDDSIIQNEPGYLTFSWLARDKANGLDTETESPEGGIEIVKYQFTTSQTIINTLFDSETLTVMPWPKTAAAATNEDPNIWIESDAVEAIGGGYYAAMRVDNIDEMQPMLFEFEYENKTRHRVSFTVVYEKEEGVYEPIKDATVIFRSTANTDDSYELTTDEEGYAKEIIDKAGEYEYRVSANGFWPNPADDEETGAQNFEKFDIVNTGFSKQVVLVPHELHNVTVTAATDGSFKIGTNYYTTGQTAEDAAIKFVDFYFDAVPNPGYVLKPDSIKYKIGEGEEKALTLDADTNRYKIDGNEITGTIYLTAEFVADTFKVTATHGEGGSMTYDAAAQSSPYEVIDIAAGTDTKEFVFTPEAGKVVYQVVINGEVYPVDDPEAPFKHTFTNVTSDQTISVIFAVKDSPATEYVVSVIVGDYGKTDVTIPGAGDAGADFTETIVAGDRKDYILATTQTLKAEVAPVTDYVIDKVYKNDVEEVLATSAAHTVEVEYDATLERQSVVSTFKKTDDGKSFQYWVTTQIVGGLGTVEPAGGKLYYPSEKPTFTFDPEDKWMVESVILKADSYTNADPESGTQDGLDVTGSVVANQYTFDSLTEDTIVLVTFGEVKITVTGVVTFAQVDKEPTSTNEIEATLPLVVFTRESDNQDYVAIVGAEAQTRSGNQASAAFSVELPEGHYTITATKHGHLKYVIGGSADEGTKFAITVDVDPSKNTAVQIKNPINLISGETNTDDFISFFDILRVSAGMGNYMTRSDIDEDGVVGIKDMGYTKGNYAKPAVDETFTDHEAHVSTDSGEDNSGGSTTGGEDGGNTDDGGNA